MLRKLFEDVWDRKRQRVADEIIPGIPSENSDVRAAPVPPVLSVDVHNVRRGLHV